MTTARPAETTPAPQSTLQPAETRIDVLRGDRCCAGCGFNLYGQVIVREGHYRMLIVRCPECGTVAALQEYPTLTRMAWRVRMLLAAVWLAAILGGLVVTGAVIYGFSQAVMQTVTASYQSAVQAAWTEYSTKSLTPAQQAAWWNTQGMDDWWKALPPSAFFADHGGWAGLDWWGALILTFAAATLVPIGVVWSVALARLRGVRLLAVLLIPLFIAGVFAAGDFVNGSGTWFLGAQYLVRRQIGWLPMAGAAGACLLTLFAGALAGRPIARAFLRLTLPARLLAAFAFLWLVDGKDLPRAVPVHPPRRG